MEKKRTDRTILVIVIVVILLLLALLLCRGCSSTSDTASTEESTTDLSSAGSSPTEVTTSGPPELVGIWEGSSPELGEFSIVIEKTAPVPDSEEDSRYVSGYVVFGEDPSGDPIAPLSGIANSTGGGEYEVKIWSTNLVPSQELGDGVDDQAHPMLITGTVDTEEDAGEGTFKAGEETGGWQVEYHQVEPAQPVYDVDHSGLWIDYDVSAAIHTIDQNGEVVGQFTQIDVFTNIAVSTVMVTSPDGKRIMLERSTDIFSPGVDFISELRFAWGGEGSTAVGEYVFSFLDPMGEPLVGLESADYWSGCETHAPLDVQAEVGVNGIIVSWGQVAGFDPGDPEGFYQIALALDSGDGDEYGSNHIQRTSHLMPFATFTPGSTGSPDGEDYGVGLGQLTDGTYNLVVYVFSPANRVAGGIGFECQLTAEDEWQTVGKSGDRFIINE